MIDEDITQLLSGSTTAAKFDAIGVVYRGKILAARTRQQRDMKTGEPQVWTDGSPKKEILIDIQTELRDTPDDDGVRRIYARGQMIAALREALAASKAQLAIGGTLAVKYYGDGEPSQRGFNPPKLFQAKYEPPAVAALKEEDF